MEEEYISVPIFQWKEIELDGKSYLQSKSNSAVIYEKSSFLAESSRLMERISKGQVCGEFGSPNISDMSPSQMRKRAASVDLNRASHMIKKVQIKDNVLAADIKMLDNPIAEMSAIGDKVKYDFGIRAIVSTNTASSGQVVAAVLDLVTFDIIAPKEDLK